MKKGGYILKKRRHFPLLFAVFLCFLIFIPNAFATPMAGDTIDSDKGQDQLVLVTEPVTILLCGLSLLFMGVLFRRKFIKLGSGRFKDFRTLKQ